MEKQEQLFHPFHRPLEISPTPRDFHIPTAWLRPGWKSGKPQAGFPLSHAGARDHDPCLPLTEPKTEERKSAAARPPSSSLFRITLYWKWNSVSGSSLD